jgi:diguanylate cyclase (GGDEF)-like protein/PAS domain S-box-containing protein
VTGLPGGRHAARREEVTTSDHQESVGSGVHLDARTVVDALAEPAALIDMGGRVLEVNGPLCEMTGATRDDLIGRPAPDAWWTVAPWTDDALIERDDLPGAIVGSGGMSVPVLCRVSSVRDPGGRDLRLITFSRSAERHGQGALTRLAVEQAALARVAQEVARGAETPALFDLVARETATVLGVEAALVLRYSSTSSEVVGAFGEHGSQVGTVFPLTGSGAAVQVARTGRPARADYAKMKPGDATGDMVLTQGYRRGIAAPVTVDRRRWGAVLAATTSERQLPPDAEARIERFADMVSLAIAQAELLGELARRATTDSLTGLLNQGEFHNRLRQEHARALRYGRPLALVLFDLDHFKAINDSLGHQVGDRTLKAVAEALAPQVRPQDVLGRVGGEEFGLILPEAAPGEAYRVAERLRAVVEGMKHDDLPHITVSAGVAEIAADRGIDVLYTDADRAMYEAKRGGRNRVCCAADVAAA